MPIASTYTARNARWSVYYRRKGKWKRRKFVDDFPVALRFFATLPSDSNPTLHCDNVGFSPPRSLTEAKREEWEIVKRHRGGRVKKFKKKIIVVYNKLEDLNHQGIWWCPYCIKLRRFKEISTDRGLEVCCPVCWISNFDFSVRQANPIALNVQLKSEMKRGTNSVKASKAKRRRR